MNEESSLSIGHLTEIENVLRTCKLFGLDGVLFANNSVSATDNLVLITSETSLPTENIGKLAFNRIDLFLKRLSAVKTRAGYGATAVSVERDGKKVVKQLNLKTDGVNVEFGCCSPDKLPELKTFISSDLVDVIFADDEAAMISKMISTVDTPSITINIEGNRASIDISDVDGGDVVVIDLANPVKGDVDEDFSLSYHFDKNAFSALINNTNANKFSICCEKGMLMIEINGIDVFLRPNRNKSGDS
jgi:hypothetical protein